MKRQTALNHGFVHGQTILYGGRFPNRHARPITVKFTRSGARRIILRSDAGHADITLMAEEPFWAAPALPDAAHLLASMVVEYVNVSRQGQWSDADKPARLYGWAQCLIHAAMVTYGLSEEGATERIADMINDVETGRD